jgi:hypothetical protein
MLSRSTLMMIRRVLHAYRKGWVLEPRLAAAARMAAEDARQSGVAAERMLVALERAWAELEDARRLSVPGAGELLSRLVTLCIGAYDDPALARRRSIPRSGSGPKGPAGARSAA